MKFNEKDVMKLRKEMIIEKDDFLEKKTEKFYNKTPENLLFTSKSLFTKGFMSDLKKLLGENNGESFKKLSKTEKKELAEKIDSLLDKESIWKKLMKKSKYENQQIEDLYSSELRKFITLFTSHFYSKDKETIRQRRKRGSERSKFFFDGVLRFLQQNYSEILSEEGKNYLLSNKDYTTLVNEIKPKDLFSEIVKISMKKAYDTNINIKYNNTKRFFNTHLDSNFLKAKKIDLSYSFSTYLTIYLSNILFHLLSKKGLLKDNSNTYIIACLKNLQTTFKQERKKVFFAEKQIWYFESTYLTHLLLSFFEETGVIKHIYKEKTRKPAKYKEYIIYVFNHKLDNSIASAHNIPRILPPSIAESKDEVVDWIAPVKNGYHNIQVSDEAIKSLHIAQKKQFVVSEKFENLLKEVNRERKKQKEFPTEYEFNEQVSEYKKWSETTWSNSLKVVVFSLLRNKLSLQTEVPEKMKTFTKMARICGITRMEYSANTTKNLKKFKLATAKSNRQILLTSLDISNLYKGYCLYYSTRLDFRLRMYPLEYLMSRTSGYLKNLLEEHKPRRLTTIGFKNMLTAYYSPEPEKLQKFNEEKQDSFQSMGKFFQENKINLSNQALYFELLQIEISDLLNSKIKKTALQLEIDQVGSGPTLIALLTSNKILAEKCNLLEGPFSCIYSYLLKQTKIFFKEKMSNINTETKAFKFLTENRKSQKYALMCFFYNEEHRSRTDRWIEQYEEIYEITVPEDEKELFHKFSIEYPEFMNYVFPNLKRQLDILNEAALIVVEQNLPIKIDTLE